ncbi:MAG: FHA domain-containing protein, partial [Acidobacteriota bacterium]
MLELRFFVDGEERSLPLSGQEIRFGRSGENEVVLPDYSVSRRHAAIRPTAEGYDVFDLGSTNGVQINGQNVQQAALRAGDLLKIGVFELRILGGPEAGPLGQPGRPSHPPGAVPGPGQQAPGPQPGPPQPGLGAPMPGAVPSPPGQAQGFSAPPAPPFRSVGP